MSADQHLQRLLAQARDKGDLAAIKFYENAMATPGDKPDKGSCDGHCATNECVCPQ